MRDSYIRFFSEGYISKEQFFEFGLKETIYPTLDKAEKSWMILKNNIINNLPVYIRGFGRNGSNTHLFQEFYKRTLINTNVKKDPTNNTEPTKIIRDLTGYSKVSNKNFESIRNYQVSHIFGRTKNIYAFTAPWNIVYTPKILDPFTGHEAQGELIDEYTILFQKQSYMKFSRLIEDFNQIITEASFRDKLHSTLQELSMASSFELIDIEKFKKAVSDQFKPIEVQV